LAEAHGVAPHPDTEAACWSFYRNKIVCGEEGGAASFNRDVANLAALARRLRCHGFTEEHDFWHSPGGHNYRLANSLAAIIIDSLRSSRPRLEARRRAEAAYDRLCPDAWRMPPRDAPWVYDLRVPGMTRARQDRVVRSLNEAGVGARHGFKPLSQQPEYRPLRRGTGPVADRASGEVIYLPINPGGSPGLPATTDERVETAFDVLRAALG
jgi:dTDP-4-amino-4,6-dideoxygalactose transaminase